MRSKRAFTLIEILVVIAIVAIIAAIIFPVFAKAKKSALATQDIEQLRQVYIGLNLYREDYEQKYPDHLDQTAQAYVKKDILVSPADKRNPGADGKYPADRFLNLPGETTTRLDYKISYAYLKAFEGRFPYAGLWDFYIDNPKWSLLSCADYLYLSSSITVSPATEHGEWTDKGMYLRIRMDGSLRKAPKSNAGISVGGAYEELFYYPAE